MVVGDQILIGDLFMKRMRERGKEGEALKSARAWRCGEDAVFPFSVPTKQKCLVGEMLGI